MHGPLLKSLFKRCYCHFEANNYACLIFVCSQVKGDPAATLALVAAGHRLNTNQLKAVVRSLKRPRSSSASSAASGEMSQEAVLENLKSIVDSEFAANGSMTRWMTELDAQVDDAMDSSEDAESESDEEEQLSAKQLQRLSNMSRHPVDERCFGNWKEMARVSLQQLHLKRRIRTEKMKRKWLQLEEAIEHVEKSKRLRCEKFRDVATSEEAEFPSGGWRELHSSLQEEKEM